MATYNPSNTVVVLDLDDTLYKEADYQASGLDAVCKLVETLYGKSVKEEVFRLQQVGERDVLGGICKVLGVPLSVKESLLWLYRLHEPAITLNTNISTTMQQLELGYQIAILSDGHSISQRLKLKALGLGHLQTYISEDHQDNKPSAARFQIIMRDMPAERYVYVGDNPAKDFIAPNQLGWISIGLRGNSRNIHTQTSIHFKSTQLPKIWIDHFSQLINAISK
jgi:putative hydrolase of the HAD superfamily